MRFKDKKTQSIFKRKVWVQDGVCSLILGVKAEFISVHNGYAYIGALVRLTQCPFQGYTPVSFSETGLPEHD